MEEKITQLPENAHRELKPGEEYQPLLSPKKNYPEVTVWSVTLGIIMTVIFSAEKMTVIMIPKVTDHTVTSG